MSVRTCIVAAVALVSAAGCESPQERVREHLVALEAESTRLGWSCDALAQGLGAWLDLHESEVSGDVAALVDVLDDADDDEERAEILAEATPPGRPEALEALARCGERSDVRAVIDRIAGLLAPLDAGREPPMPEPPLAD